MNRSIIVLKGMSAIILINLARCVPFFSALHDFLEQKGLGMLAAAWIAVDLGRGGRTND